MPGSASHRTKLALLYVQLQAAYAEVFRVLKPGSYFASYEWVSTKEYDPNNRDHVRIIDEINYGNGLPVLPLPLQTCCSESCIVCLLASDQQYCNNAVTPVIPAAGDADVQRSREGWERLWI